MEFGHEEMADVAPRRAWRARVPGPEGPGYRQVIAPRYAEVAEVSRSGSAMRGAPFPLTLAPKWSLGTRHSDVA